MEKPILEIRPQMAVAVIPILFGNFVLSGFISFFVYNFTRSWIHFLSIFVVLFIGLIFFAIMNLKARRYIFYKEKAEFYEGFLNIVQRTVRYEKVTDCVLTKSVWDRLFETGTIRLVTAGHEGKVGGGIRMQYVENPDAVYKRVEELLKK